MTAGMGPAWIYALPGSDLVPGMPAGAPALEQLDDQPGPWQAWLLYGPPPQALAALAQGQDQGNDLEAWRRQLQLAGRLKRQHRQRVTLLDTTALTADEREALLRQLPELQNQTMGQPWPGDLLELAARTVLRLNPGLRAAYLDLEAEADRGGSNGTESWRQDPDADDWLALLRGGVGGADGAGPAPAVAADLEGQLRRQQEWLTLLQNQEEELERELEDHLNVVQAMAGQLPLLEAQLARARQALEALP